MGAGGNEGFVVDIHDPTKAAAFGLRGRSTINTLTLNTTQPALHQEVPVALLNPVECMRETHGQDANTWDYPGVRANGNAIHQFHTDITSADRPKPEEPRELIRDRKLVKAISNILNGKHELFLGVRVKLD